jgi:hypothetical protein
MIWTRLALFGGRSRCIASPTQRLLVPNLAPPPTAAAQLGRWARSQLSTAPNNEMTAQQLLALLPLDLAHRLAALPSGALGFSSNAETLLAALASQDAEPTTFEVESSRGLQSSDTKVRLAQRQSAAAKKSPPPPALSADGAEAVLQSEVGSSIMSRIAYSPRCSVIAELYQALTRDQRMAIRQSCGSVVELLRAGGARHLIRVSRDGLRATRVSTSRDDGSSALEAPPSSTGAPSSSVAKKSSSSVSLSASSAHRDFVPLSVELEDIRLIYQPAMPHGFSPPPAPTGVPSVSAASKLSARGVACAGVFTADMMVPLIPTFFIPMAVLSPTLPEGYTLDHVRQLFVKTQCVEIVTVAGDEFVRMHGGNQLVNLSGSYETNQRFAEQFAPDPFLCDHFISKMPKPYKWASLREVIEASDPAVEATLPFHFMQSILFFAQMQHRFCFTADNGGEVCHANAVEQLSHLTSPTPAALNEVCRRLAGGSLDTAELTGDGGLSDGAILEILAFFGTFESFCIAHGTVLHYCPNTRLVTLMSTIRAREKRALPLEQQLELALQNREKQDARKIRRKMAILRNPDNPLLDRAKLSEEVKRFLPRRHHVAMRTFIRSLPPDMVDVFPENHILFFKNQPEHFTVFEYKVKGKLHLMRAGIPLPPGHLRLEYSEYEIVQMTAAVLADHPRRMSDTFARLPWGAREVLRLKYKGLFEVLKLYPQYFTIVFKDSIRLDSRNATVELVGQPPTMMDDAAWGNVNVQLTPEDDGQMDDDALALLRERGGGGGGSPAPLAGEEPFQEDGDA